MHLLSLSLQLITTILRLVSHVQQPSTRKPLELLELHNWSAGEKESIEEEFPNMTVSQSVSVWDEDDGRLTDGKDERAKRTDITA